MGGGDELHELPQGCLVWYSSVWMGAHKLFLSSWPCSCIMQLVPQRQQHKILQGRHLKFQQSRMGRVAEEDRSLLAVDAGQRVKEKISKLCTALSCVVNLSVSSCTPTDHT
jgi:hypothetical protein